MITIQMRPTALFIAVACWMTAASWGQQAAAAELSVTALLDKLHSSSGPERAAAFERLRSTPGNLHSPRVRKALLDLLNWENHDLDSQLAEAQKKGYPDNQDSEGEGFGIYYSELVEVVDSFANWNDPHQACILVEASSSDDSAFAAEIADHAKVTIPCLLKRAGSAISMNRAVAVPVLIQAVAKGKDGLDSKTIQAARQIELAALQDSDDSVRAFTIHALGKFGGTDMIASLRRVAETDPSPEVQGHSIRKAAAEAIDAIQKRASGPVMPGAADH